MMGGKLARNGILEAFKHSPSVRIWPAAAEPRLRLQAAQNTNTMFRALAKSVALTRPERRHLRAYNRREATPG